VTHGSWVTWVMGQELNGSLGSWVTLSDPFPALIQIDWIILNRDDEQFTLTTKNQKIIFNTKLFSRMNMP